MKIFIILFFVMGTATAKDCPELNQAAEMLETNKLLKAYKQSKAEPVVKLADSNMARTYVYKHSVLKDLGFDLPSKNQLSGWKPYSSRLEKSKLFNKKIGWQKKLDDGSSARVRLDWDPETGGHYNIEVFKAKINGKSETLKLKVEFNCAGKKCSEQEILSLVQKMNH